LRDLPLSTQQQRAKEENEENPKQRCGSFFPPSRHVLLSAPPRHPFGVITPTAGGAPSALCVVDETRRKRTRAVVDDPAPPHTRRDLVFATRGGRPTTRASLSRRAPPYNEEEDAGD